jgi:hypothetical protein
MMRALDPESADMAAGAAHCLRRDEPPPPVFDDFCLKTAEALQDPDTPGSGAWTAPERDRLIKLLAMTPILRQVLIKLPVWVRNLNSEHMAAVRLAFKDVTEVAEDAGPLFMEVMMIHLDEPSQVLRLVSAVMDRPSDRYLASSELCGLGERLLADIDLRVASIRQFDPGRGFEGGASEAASVLRASSAIHEFEQWLALNREGPWGSRIAMQKQGLAQAAEARLRETEPAVSAALPLQAQRAPGNRQPRAGPRIDGYPHPGLVQRAEGLLAFLDETRTSAANAGFGSLRAKVIESLEQRLDHYVEDLIERLRLEDEPDPDCVRAYLEVAADFSGMVKGPKAAQIVRRRAAAA